MFCFLDFLPLGCTIYYGLIHQETKLLESAGLRFLHVVLIIQILLWWMLPFFHFLEEVFPNDHPGAGANCASQVNHCCKIIICGGILFISMLVDVFWAFLSFITVIVNHVHAHSKARKIEMREI